MSEREINLFDLQDRLLMILAGVFVLVASVSFARLEGLKAFYSVLNAASVIGLDERVESVRDVIVDKVSHSYVRYRGVSVDLVRLDLDDETYFAVDNRKVTCLSKSTTCG